MTKSNARREDFILQTIKNLHAEHGSVAAMTDLRPILLARGLSWEAQDQSLKSLSQAGRIHLFPESNRKTLRQEHHDAAIELRDGACHYAVPA